MPKFISPYYPPRAKWHSGLRRLPGTLLRQLRLDRFPLPQPVEGAANGLAAALIVPGLIFCRQGRRLLGRSILAAWLLAALGFLVFLGHPLGNFLFGLMISLHGTSISRVFLHLFAGEPIRARLLWVGLLSLGLSMLVYYPSLGQLQKHLFMPLRVHGQVCVVNCQASTADLRRGDVIAYRIFSSYGNEAGDEEGFHGGAYHIKAGYGLDHVLALPGERVQFTAEQFIVNGVHYPREPDMPVSGDWVVPEHCWFVWPRLDMQGHGAISAEFVSELRRRKGVVKQSAVLGRMYGHWFWRRQSLP